MGSQSIKSRNPRPSRHPQVTRHKCVREYTRVVCGRVVCTVQFAGGYDQIPMRFLILSYCGPSRKFGASTKFRRRFRGQQTFLVPAHDPGLLPMRARYNMLTQRFRTAASWVPKVRFFSSFGHLLSKNREFNSSFGDLCHFYDSTTLNSTLAAVKLRQDSATPLRTR